MPHKEGIFVIIEYDPDNIEDWGEIEFINEDRDRLEYVKIFTTYESAMEVVKRRTKEYGLNYKIVELTP